ncbi:MAG: nicotinate (nicotinamide) nucleotide adenylyltransferase [Deltaproteobacteria bacterium]|nr:nicotinate (nicotinamide) nucleotide adenylyltransferase [Deltaproteobacteria bacterium]MBW1872208.1 nicotinate (nicotinamide) nucleotide adenylyltransferase [Deltaproteobacteria bacterium]
MRVALLGGSFNPPHLAHQMACLYLLEGRGFERVWLMPCFLHAFDKQLVSFEHRVAMCALLSRPFGGRVVVSEVEQNLAGDKPNRTIDTMQYLDAHHAELEFTLVIGTDILDEVSKWKDFDKLKQKYPILVLKRTGFEPSTNDWDISELAFPQISSSSIRERLGQGEQLSGLVPATVAGYIRQNSLYR